MTSRGARPGVPDALCHLLLEEKQVSILLVSDT